MTNLTEIKAKLPETLILEFLNSMEDCTIDLVMLVELGVYSRKDYAVEVLKKNFEEGIEFSRVNRKNPMGGRPSDYFLLTSDCFVEMCLLANTPIGKLVRTYFMGVERQWRKQLKEKQTSDTDIHKLVDELFEVLFEMFWNSADAIVNIQNCTVRQQKKLKAEYKKGISKEVLYSLAQEMMGDVGHNAAHQHKEIIQKASKKLQPYKELFLAKFQEMQQSLELPPAPEPVVIKEYIRIGVPKTEATFIEQMEGIHEDLSTGNWKSYGKNWIEYSQKRWNVSKTHGYRLRDAADIYAQFKTAGVKPLPTNEHQIRELPRLSKEQQIEVWLKAVEIEGAEPSPATVETLVEKEIHEHL